VAALMGQTTLQASFTGGEISPSLYARVDLARYGTALKTCRNWIVQRHGGVVTRPGFQYLGALDGTVSRLLEFTLSPDESVLVELTDASTRFWRNGALQSSWTFPTSFYTAAQLPGIVAAQVGAQMILTHPEVAPRRLNFISVGVGFTFTTDLTGSPTVTPPTAPSVTAFDATTPTKPHSYCVTAVNPVSGVESAPSGVLTLAFNLQADKPATINTGLSTPANIYRGRNGVFGYIGTTETAVFLDENVVPDYSSPPPQWPNPFADPGTYPVACTHYQQRRWFGGSTLNPQTLTASRASDLGSFDAASPARDDDAIEVTLAATQGQGIRHLVPLDRLIVMTSRAEWSASAGNDAVLTPNNTGFQLESTYGASAVPPVLTGSGAVYVQAQGTRVRDLVFVAQLQQFGGTDLTVLASHLFEGYTITDLAWSSYPFSCVWAVRNDGVLLCLTYLREQDVFGWSQHVTDGLVERIAVVREGQQERLYAVIRRNGVRMLERLTDRFTHDPLLHVGLDSALSYDGRNTDPSRTVTLTGASWSVGSTLTATWGGTAPSGLTVGDVVQVTDAAGVRVCSAVVLAVVSPTQATVRAERDVPVGLRSIATARWALAQDGVSGLTHLAGRTVSAVVDGAVQTGLTVQSDGRVALQYPGAVIHVGLPYVCDMETLDLSMPNAVVRDRVKNITRVTVQVEATRGLTASVPPLDAVELKQRDQERYEEPIALFTGTFEVRVPTGWQTPGRVRLTQSYPLPATVLAIMPEVTVGG
jgi:hypothetical protein